MARRYLGNYVDAPREILLELDKFCTFLRDDCGVKSFKPKNNAEVWKLKKFLSGGYEGALVRSKGHGIRWPSVINDWYIEWAEVRGDGYVSVPEFWKIQEEIKKQEMSEEKVAIVSTSDRGQFRRCRRSWNWSSHLRESLSPHEQALPLWLGTGFHHCMEDVHGYRAYESNQAAWDDYFQATVKYFGEDRLPVDAIEQGEMVVKMLDYYEHTWLKARQRDPLETYVLNGVPQVEVPFEFEVPIDPKILKASGYDRAVYKGVIDRVVIDSNGYLYLTDYKSSAKFGDRRSLELDSQIGVYLWAATYLYKRPVLGFYYMQFKKAVCNPPNINKDGAMSVDKRQNTSYWKVREYLKEKYGPKFPSKALTKELDFMHYMMEFEDDDKDGFIARTLVTRPPETMDQEANIVVSEVEDMLDPRTRIYPNPTFLCGGCSFLEPCLEFNQGLNWNQTLDLDYYKRDYTERSSWSAHLEVNPHEGKEVRKASGRDKTELLKKKKKAPVKKKRVRAK